MKEKYFDLLGVYAAFLCMVHCLLAPVLLLFPIGMSHNPIIDCAFLVFGAFPVLKVLRGKTPIYLKILLPTSLLIVATAIGLEAVFHMDTFLIYIGALGLILGHCINYKNHKY